MLSLDPEPAVYSGGVRGFDLFPLLLPEQANERRHRFVAAALA